MAIAALGSKRVCVACAARFYDLMRAPAVCPKCSTEQPIDVPRPPRAPRGATPDRRFRKTAPVPSAAEGENESAETEDAEEEDEDDEAAEDDGILIDDDESGEKETAEPEH